MDDNARRNRIAKMADAAVIREINARNRSSHRLSRLITFVVAVLAFALIVFATDPHSDRPILDVSMWIMFTILIASLMLT